MQNLIRGPYSFKCTVAVSYNLLKSLTFSLLIFEKLNIFIVDINTMTRSIVCSRISRDGAHIVCLHTMAWFCGRTFVPIGMHHVSTKVVEELEYFNELHANLNSSPVWLVEIYLIEINGLGKIRTCWSAAGDVLQTSAFISCRSLIETDRPVCVVNLNANRPNCNLALKFSLKIVSIFKRASLLLENFTAPF